MIMYTVTLWVVAISGEYLNSCPRTTDYAFCPAFDYDDQTLNECPSGWTCEGDARVVFQQIGGEGFQFFYVGGDSLTGAGTSDYFPVPESAYDLRWGRSGGADDGGVIIEDSEGNTICDVRDGADTNIFFEQTCVIEDYVGQCIRIYTWDSVRYFEYDLVMSLPTDIRMTIYVPICPS